MAKKRKEESEEEEFDFKLPKFDEQAFLKRERRNIKTTVIAFLFGCLVAVISFGFWALLSSSFLRWELVLLFGVFNAAWIRYLFLRLNIDLADFGRKGWLGTYAIYFLTWVILLIVLVNPPFYDDVPPMVTAVSLPELQEAGGTVKILAKITDNVGVNTQDITLSIQFPDGTNQSPVFSFENSILSYTYENPTNMMGTYYCTIAAKDRSGHTTIVQGSFTYDNDTIRLPDPAGTDIAPGPMVTYASALSFDVKGNVSRVYYTVDDGLEINATKQGDFYQSYPKYIGWEKNKNVTVHAYAQVIYYFEHLNQPFNNTIVDSQPYYFQVGSDGIAQDLGPSVTLPQYKPIPVPGFEAIVFLSAIGVALFLFVVKRKKKTI